jgi:hypothetical protein
MAKSVAHQRKLTVYATPKNHKLINQVVKDQSVSKFINSVLSQYFREAEEGKG